MLDSYNKDFEGKILKNVSAATNSIKQELTPLLEEKVKGESAIDHTMSLLDTNVINQQIIQDSLNGNGQSQGQSLEKEKVRVKTMDGPMPFATPAPSSEPTNNYNPMSNIGNNSYPTGDDQNVWRAGGYTETMILIGTGVLVLLVFMVSYLLLNYFG